MRIFAALVTAWALLRWAGLVLGIVRARKLDGAMRREARRSAVSHGAIDVFVTVTAIYAWAYAMRLQPVERFVGLLAAIMMTSLAVGVIAWFMQPEDRSPQVWTLFRLRGRKNPIQEPS